MALDLSQRQQCRLPRVQVSVPYQSVGAPSFAEAGFWFSASAKGGLIAANVTCWEKGISPKIEALMLPTLCVHSDSNAPREIAGRKGWGTHGLAGDGNFASESLDADTTQK